MSTSLVTPTSTQVVRSASSAHLRGGVPAGLDRTGFTQAVARVIKSERPTYPVESVDNALVILRLLLERQELRVSEVAEHVGVAPSSAHRLLSMFVYHGFARQDEKRGRYQAGPEILKIGFAAIRQLGIRQYARPVLEELHGTVNESVGFAIPYGQEVFYIDGIESRHTLRVGLRVGAFLPANCIAIGKAILATLPREKLLRLFPSQDLPTLTPNSIATRDELERQLKKIRADGYARSRAESDDGVGSIAVAVLDNAGEACAAISVVAPLVRIKPELERRWIEAARKASEKLHVWLWGDHRVT